METLWLTGKTGRRRNLSFRCLLFFALLIFCIFQLSIHKIYGFSVYPDEFGYWASAAAGVGYDWSETASLGYYYSFGYSLLLIPVLAIFKDSIMAYRAAVMVNMFLQCTSVFMLWEIFKRWCADCLQDASKNGEEMLWQKQSGLLFAVGCAVFYPAWTFYVQTTLAEALLAFLYVFICYQFILFLERPKMIGAVFLALTFLYLYFVHMRTVGIVIAGTLTLSVYMWKEPAYRKMLFAGISVLILGALCGLWMKERITDIVYAAAGSDALAANDYSGQIGKIKSLFTLQGIWKFFLSCAGKLYYLGIASFGLLYPAIYACLREFFSKRRENQSKKYFSLFCIMSLLGQFLITAIGMIEPGRVDGIVYGRYNEYILPVLMGIGLLTFRECGHKLRDFLISVVISTVLFCITYLNTLHSGLTAMQGYFASGISYLSDDWHYDVRTEPMKAFFFGILLMTFVRGCLCAGERFRKYISRLSVLGAILAMEILLTVCLQKKYTWLFNDVNYYNLQIYAYIEEYKEGRDEKVPVTYLYDGGLPYIDLLQFVMRDEEIEIIRLPDAGSMERMLSETFLPEKGFLIVDSGCPYLAEIGEVYTKCKESKAFLLFLAE